MVNERGDIMKKFSLIIIFVCLFCGAAFSQEVAGVDEENKSAVEIDSSATIKSVTGMATIQKKDSNEWKKLSYGDALNEGDQISIGPDSNVIMDIDGNVVTLMSGTLFTFKSLSAEMKIELWHGKMRAKLKKLKKVQKFEVHSPIAVCAVRGTEFNMEVFGDNTAVVQTFSGSVSVKDLTTGEEVIVKSGYQCTVKPGMKKPQLSPIPEPEEEKEKKEEIAPEEEEKKPEKAPVKKAKATKAGLGVNGSFGADVLIDEDGNKKVYYCISLLPELSIWKFGVGLDINIYFDEEGNLRDEDWNNFNDIIGKIWYVRYGNRGEPFFALIGGIKSYSLGHGFILSNYTNMLNYPAVRNKGLLVEANLAKVGFESAISNIDSYPVIGGRFYYRPLLSTEIPLLKHFTLGLTGVMDQNPDRYDATRDDEIIFYGADCKMPLINIFPVKTFTYFDYATYKPGDTYNLDNHGKGTAIGVGGSVIEKIKFAIEYRKMDNNFIPGYFGTYYEVERHSKPLLISSYKRPFREGPFFMLGFDVLNKLKLRFTFEDYNIDPASRYPYLHGEVVVDPSLLLDRFTLGISYDNKNVNSLKDIAELNGAILTVEIGYMIAPNIILAVTQKQTFDESGKPTKTMSMRTRFRF